MTPHPLLAALGRDPEACAARAPEAVRSWGALADRATRLGRAWSDTFGVAAGGRTAVVLGNRVAFVEAMVAALLSGTWLVPVSWRLGPAEIAAILEDLDVRVVMTDAAHIERVTAAIGDRRVAVVDVDRDLEPLLASARDEPFGISGAPGGGMFTTSGTTGRPKGVRRAMAPSVERQLDTVRAAGLALGLDGAGPHLLTGPMYHAAPMGFALMDLYLGAPMHIMARFDPAEVLERIDADEVRDSHLVPTMFVRLLRLDEAVRARFSGSSLHTVLHGAAPITIDVKRAMIDWWGECLVEYWGASEGGVVTLVGARDWLAHPGTVGRPLPTYEVFAGTEEAEPLPADTVGLLWCRHRDHDRVFEYVDDPDKTAATHRLPRTYTTGDIGRVDPDGWVFLADRAANMIISGGVNIYPAEIEAVLASHPAVADVAVFGIPDDEWGEQVKAVVELVDGVTASPGLDEEILQFARSRLAGYKVPRSVDVVAELPRHDTGKLHVRSLRDPHWAGRDRAI